MVVEIEAGKMYRHEYKVRNESSILYPIITDQLLNEFRDGYRDRFEINERSYHGPYWPAHINYWPSYDIKPEAERVIRVWKRVATILRTQIVGKTTNKIENYLKLVSIFP